MSTMGYAVSSSNDNNDDNAEKSSLLNNQTTPTPPTTEQQQQQPNTNNKQPSSPPSKTNNTTTLLPKSSLLYALIFFTSMIIMELALEATSESFPSYATLPYAVTLFQFLFCFLLPTLTSRGAALATVPRTLAAVAPYVSLSLVVFASTCLATMSIRYCSYPTKVVFKSAKLIPTMIVATFLQRGGRRYGALDYVAACLLCVGAAGYSYNAGKTTASSDNLEGAGGDDEAYIGILLLLISVFADAFTPNLQQRLMAPPETAALPTAVATNDNKSSFGKCCTALSSLVIPPNGGGLGLSAAALMVNVNVVGFAGLLCYMMLFGSFSEFLATARTRPSLLAHLSLVGLGLSSAVLAYTRLIRESGSVVAVGVATLRKVATVVLSYIVFPKVMSTIHVVSGIFVLGGIVLSSYSKQRGKGVSSHES